MRQSGKQRPRFAYEVRDPRLLKRRLRKYDARLKPKPFPGTARLLRDVKQLLIEMDCLAECTHLVDARKSQIHDHLARHPQLKAVYDDFIENEGGTWADLVQWVKKAPERELQREKVPHLRLVVDNTKAPPVHHEAA